MNSQIRKLGIALCVCYVALFGMLNYVQVFHAQALNDDPNNVDRFRREFAQNRGTITTADGTVIAESVPVDDEFRYQRRYPTNDLFAPVTGYFSFEFGADGLERSYQDELVGDTAQQQFHSFGDLFVDEDIVGNLTTTLRDDLQETARTQLGQRRGAVVALDPRSGAVLALWNYPTYDPNALASHDLEDVRAVRQFLNPSDPNSSLVQGAYEKRFFPGSTFKTVTGSIGVDTGTVTPDNPVYPQESTYTPPQTTRPLSNFGGEVCGGALFEILAVSCNTSFARMGVETNGPERMVAGAEAFGFNHEPPLDLPRPVASNFPTDFTDNLPALAQSSIGQNDVQASPLQMALVAATIANDGVTMAPYTVEEIRDADGDVVDRHDPEVWRRPIGADAAAVMRDAMRGVATGGTAASTMNIPGLDVGAKTGTAQLGTDPPSSHAWMIAWAGHPGGPPEIAVAVLVEAQPGVSETTGNTAAGPIAAAIIQQALSGG